MRKLRPERVVLRVLQLQSCKAEMMNWFNWCFFFHTRETQKLAGEGIKNEVVSIIKSKMSYCHVDIL